MCYSTKEKIAGCVKELMRHKEIRKITIQDIMIATNMSRQSFYYHFKDIYDVLEWIAVNDLAGITSSDENIGIEEWILRLLTVIRRDKFFYEKVVREIEWPKIFKCVKKPVEPQMMQVAKSHNTNYAKLHARELQFCIDYFSTSLIYYILDCIYQGKCFSNEEIIRSLHFILSIQEGSGMNYITANAGAAG